MVTVEQIRRRFLWLGCALAGGASLALMTFALVYAFAAMSDLVIVPLIFALAILTAVGATVAIFNVRK